MEKEPVPSVSPELGLGDLFAVLPVLEELLALVSGAIAGHQATIPKIRVKVHGHHCSLGPTPVVIED